jgi:hypothetical protein
MNTSHLRFLLLNLFLQCLCIETLYAWTQYEKCEGNHGAVAQNFFSLTTYHANNRAEGDSSCQFSITAGTDGWAKWGGVIDFPDYLKKGDEVWINMKLFIPEDFDYSTNTGALKFVRLRQRSGTGSHEGYLDNLISVPGWYPAILHLLKEDQSYVVRYGESSSYSELPKGEWFTYELYVYFDEQTGSNGGSAIIRSWLNNELLTEELEIKTLNSADSEVISLYLFTYWNGNSPKSQSLLIDDITITSDRPSNQDFQGNPFIGGEPLTTVPRPSLPSHPDSLNVRVTR